MAEATLAAESGLAAAAVAAAVGSEVAAALAPVSLPLVPAPAPVPAAAGLVVAVRQTTLAPSANPKERTTMKRSDNWRYLSVLIVGLVLIAGSRCGSGSSGSMDTNTEVPKGGTTIYAP